MGAATDIQLGARRARRRRFLTAFGRKVVGFGIGALAFCVVAGLSYGGTTLLLALGGL